MAPTQSSMAISLLAQSSTRPSSPSLLVVNSHEALLFVGSAAYGYSDDTWSSPNATLQTAIGKGPTPRFFNHWSRRCWVVFESPADAFSFSYRGYGCDHVPPMAAGRGAHAKPVLDPLHRPMEPYSCWQITSNHDDGM